MFSKGVFRSKFVDDTYEGLTITQFPVATAGAIFPIAGWIRTGKVQITKTWTNRASMELNEMVTCQYPSTVR